MTEYLLAIENLKTYFYTREGVVPAVDGVNLTIKPGGTLALVGESGCGKSVTALSIMRLIPRPPGKIVEGRIMFNGENLLEKTESEMRAIRGNEISMIFQEPMTALNPVFTVGRQISEALILHQGLSKGEARLKAIEMLKLVGIPSPERRVDDYPHQMSGGMRQRVMIAMALSCSPKLLIADEPTTALDVTIQAQILDLMKALQKELQTAILLITHDLGVVAESVEEVAVMYLGRIVEQAAVNELFADPRHPYTIGLLGSIPKLHEDRDRLQVIEGLVPDPLHMPRGCRFHPRCPFVEAVCREEEPPTTRLPGDHLVQCWREV
ncbi:MAG: ABC transporter ATP-binding protein [Limnochordia bacterium]|mgnify:CR=1 FL=1|jgi:oligopeptide/dipeptide ABC transporter ATP-binding protein